MILLVLLLVSLRVCCAISIAGQWLSVSILGKGILDADEWLQAYEQLVTEESEYDEVDNKVTNLLEMAKITAEFLEFDSNVEFEGTSFVLNGKQYTDSDSSFYLKSSELNAQSLIADNDIVLPDEIVLGVNAQAPIIVFYGCETDDDFFDFNQNLLTEAQSGKIRLLWRPTCSLSSDPKFASFNSLTKGSWNQTFKVQPDSDFGLGIEEACTAKLLDEEELNELDLKLTALLFKLYKETEDFDRLYQSFRTIVDMFPIFAPAISSANLDLQISTDTREMLLQKGVNYDSLGLYVNGQLWRLSQLNEISLPFIIAKEWSRINHLNEVLRKYNNSIISSNLLNSFSKSSIKTLQNLQPNRYDFHRVPGFSESIIYFNDIEKDKEYKSLSENITVVFDKTDYGELPAIKQNWNEVIFVIDFDNLNDEISNEALEGLIRALGVVENGYPQRIGLLPLFRGISNPLVSEIYHLKAKKRGIRKIKNYLSDISTKSKDIKSETETIQTDLPDIKGILKKFSINETSIIVNGIITPFRKNTWHYYITTIIKHDVALLKNELKKHSPRNAISLRGILHLNSLTDRDSQYMPDHFEDVTFTRMNNTILSQLTERIVEYVADTRYNSLHTISIIHDFSTSQGLKTIQNLIAVSYKGIKLRLIHSGSLDKKWIKLQQQILTGQIQSRLDTYDEISYNAHDIVSSLSLWLPDLSMAFFNEPFAVINGKVFNIKDEIDTGLWENIIRQQAERTIDLVTCLHLLDGLNINEKVNPNFIEELSASLSELFYQSSVLFKNGLSYTSESTLPRLNIDEILSGVSKITLHKEKSVVNLTLILDPVEERTQRLLYLADFVKDLPFVQVAIILLPTEELKVNPIHRFYDQNTPVEGPGLTNEVDYPGNLDSGVKNIIDIHAFDDSKEISKSVVDGVPGLCISLLDDKQNVIDTAITIETFGYAQFRLEKLTRGLTIRSCDANYEVVSFSTDGRPNYIPSESFDVTNTIPRSVYVKVKNSDQIEMTFDETMFNILLEVNDGEEKMALEIMQKLHRKYQGKVMFYIICMNPQFLNGSIAGLVNYKILNYKWPNWLRPQRFLDRQLKSKKLLFLDTMIPKNVKYLVALSLSDDSFPLDKIAELCTNSVFALQKCVTKEDSYWNQGYWKQYLEKNRLPFYNLSSTFIINMEKFRSIKAGDKIRIHYQRMSKDVYSLSNIDFDLVNNLQLEIPMSAIILPKKKQLEQDEL